MFGRFYKRPLASGPKSFATERLRALDRWLPVALLAPYRVTYRANPVGTSTPNPSVIVATGSKPDRTSRAHWMIGPMGSSHARSKGMNIRGRHRMARNSIDPERKDWLCGSRPAPPR